MDGTGSDYRDAAMFTQSGYQCMNWADMANETVNPGIFPNSGKNCMIGKVFLYEDGVDGEGKL